jgi:hypothetical protein
MEKMTTLFIWWFIDKTTRIPLKKDKEDLRYKIQTNPKQIEKNISKNFDDYILLAAMVGIIVQKSQVTPLMLTMELQKHFSHN